MLIFAMMASSVSAPWPDPTSHILSKIDFGVPLVELFEWLDVRDTLLGQNYKKQDLSAALALARDCKHPDAVWLTSIFEGKDISTPDKARKVFLLNQNDARALCFAWWLTDGRADDLSLLRRASEMGNGFACSTLCREVWIENKEEAFRLAQLSANQQERDGFYWLGFCFCAIVGCEKDLYLASENYLISAELGHIWSAACLGRLLDEFNPVRWFWLGRAASRGRPLPFLVSFSKQVELFFSGSGNATFVFLIGRALKGNINVEKKEIFGKKNDFNPLIGPANQAVSFYESQIKFARLAVDTWTFLSTSLRMIKDIRIYIGKLIWEARFEANYKI